VYTARTPGSAAPVRLRPEGTDTLTAGCSDMHLVWIDIVGADGTVVYYLAASVSFEITGGSIAGPATLTMKAGQLVA
jgi:hypothetical protein